MSSHVLIRRKTNQKMAIQAYKKRTSRDEKAHLQCKLVGDVVVIVSNVPKGQAQKQTIIDTLELVHE